MRRPDLLDAQGRPTFKREGIPRFAWRDVYLYLLTMRWRWLFPVITLLYLVVNVAFALAYLALGDAIENAHPGSFLDCFYFSVQTMATIGYGKMTPATDAANLLVALEALLGMLGIATATGLIFAKFSHPAARVLFSSSIIVGTRDGKRSLFFRAANERTTQIVEATMRLSILRDEVTPEGEQVRRLYELPLVRSTSAMFALSWLVVHQIDDKSPLRDVSPEVIDRDNIFVIATLVGMEEVSGETVHARHAWNARDWRWNHRFADIIRIEPDGTRVMQYAKFHEVIELPAPAASPPPA